MAAVKDRYQNPTIGDTVILKVFVLNSNMSAEVQAVNEVSIFYLDPNMVGPLNPEGRVLVQTFPGSVVTNPCQGEYVLTLYLDPAIYKQTGRYIDQWNVVFQPGEPPATLDHLFQIYPELWFTTPIPIVYDFSFYFQPNRIRQGSKKFIEIEIIPNVPRATDLQAYYENLVISAQVAVFIQQKCGDCVPCESDLQLVVDGQPVQYREKNRAYYFIDTTLFDCGIYDIWFQLDFGGSVYVGDKNQLQIYS